MSSHKCLLLYLSDPSQRPWILSWCFAPRMASLLRLVGAALLVALVRAVSTTPIFWRAPQCNVPLPNGLVLVSRLEGTSFLVARVVDHIITRRRPCREKQLGGAPLFKSANVRIRKRGKAAVDLASVHCATRLLPLLCICLSPLAPPSLAKAAAPPLGSARRGFDKLFAF